MYCEAFHMNKTIFSAVQKHNADTNKTFRDLTNDTRMSDTKQKSDRVSSQVKIKHCSLCPGTTEYYCHGCKGDLCRPCKEMHVDILDIKYLNVTVYTGKFNRHENFTDHPDAVIEMYCEQCDTPVCSHCRKHQQHKLVNIRTAYQNKLLQFKNSLYNAHVILNELNSDLSCHVMTSHKEINQLKTAMVSMSKRLNNSLDNVQSEISLKYRDLLICRKKNKMKRNIVMIQKYEHRYEKSANRPVQFLRFIKTVHLPQIQDTPHLSQHLLLSLTQKINTGDMIKLLSEIKITWSGKQREAGNELLPTLMSSPVLLKYILVASVKYCYHISCVTPGRLWISDWNNVILKDTATGKTIYSLKGSSESDSGNHTVNRESELIYIDNHYKIRKLSADMKTTTLLIDETDPKWKLICVYCSPSSGDLLIGMRKYDTGRFIGKVMRYNDPCRQKPTKPQNKTPDNLYDYPGYITENNNRDVVVSDWRRGAVIVTSGEGIYRFSYTGPPTSGSGLEPRGICTDALSHILVCDLTSGTVQLLSKDGEFLKYLLTSPSLGLDYYAPYSLSYDFYTHCLWVGSGMLMSHRTLSVYRHINRHPAILGKLNYLIHTCYRRTFS